MTSRREAQRLATREKLMSSALHAFARDGLDGASIDQIAAEAGYTKGAFYANFESKDDLCLTLLRERFAQRLAQLRALLADGSDVESQARAAGESFADHLAGDPDWQRLFLQFALRASRDDAFRDELLVRYGELREGVAELFAARADELGADSPLPPRELALMTSVMANGFALERLLDEDGTPHDLLATMLVIFFNGLRATRPQRP